MSEFEIVKCMAHSVLFRNEQGLYHWMWMNKDRHGLVPSPQAYAFATKRMARLYYLGKVGDHYHSILRAAREGNPLYYKAPMDLKPVRFVHWKDPSVFNKLECLSTPRYCVVGDRIRFFPMQINADPFLADYKHADRMKVAE